MANVIATHGDGFIKFDPENDYTFEMLFDSSGAYRGQTQDDFFDGGTVFISAENIDGVPCVNGTPIPPLTTEEMAEALAQRDEVDRKFGRL